VETRKHNFPNVFFSFTLSGPAGHVRCVYDWSGDIWVYTRLAKTSVMIIVEVDVMMLVNSRRSSSCVQTFAVA
jgi:hypothetical protein